MTENEEPENRRIDIDEGNYNERIEGDYVQGRNNFLNNNFVLFGSQGSSEPLTSAKHSRIRQALLKQVSLEVETRINTSLHNRVYLVLEAEQNPSQIASPWQIEVKVGSKPKVRLKDTEITKVFDEADVAGRLLILGQPGSGKTTMLLKLADDLVTRARNNSTHPIPVLFSLSSWKNDHQNIKDWLVEQLKDKYGVRQDIGKHLVNNQDIIPLLDGLDEIAAERQEKCVFKINQFLHPKNWTNSVVVCSRIQEYQRYTTLLQLNNSLELYPFSEQQVYQYLQNTDNLQLWDSLSNDPDLSQLAKTPFLLNIIVLSAEEISIQKWQQFQSSEERLSYLFDTYIRRMLKRPYQDKQPKQENTQRWLTWLAHRLIEESSTEFLIEKMQPDWFKNRVQKIIYNLIVWGIIGGLIVGLIYGLIFGLIYGLIFGLIFGLIVGLIFGLIYGLIGDLIETQINKRIVLINFQQTFSKTTISGLIVGGISGLIVGVIFGIIYGLENQNSVLGSMSIGSGSGLIIGLISGVIGNKIQTVEILIFSLKKALYGLKKGLILGLIVGLILGLIVGLIYDLIYGLTEGLISGLIVGLIFALIGWLTGGLTGGLIGGLISGINGQEIENKTFPNQGIRQSVINTIKISVVSSLFAVLIIFVIEVLLHKIGIKYNFNNQVLVNWLLSGILFGILFGILRSGTPAIKHFILRVVLWFSGYIPWNYAKFLDYCTNRLFLQRVGGGYRFIHDLLRQHFAKSYTQMSLAPIQAIPVEISPPVQNYIVCTNCSHNNPANLNFCTKCGTQLTKPHI